MLSVIYEGRDIAPDISVATAWLEMFSSDQSDALTLKLNDTRNLWDTWDPQPGDSLSVSQGAAKSGKMNIISVQPQSSLMVIKALAMPKEAGTVRRAKSWEQVRLSQLIGEVCNRHGLSYETYGVTDQVYDYVEQSNVSDFAFLSRRCALEGLGMLVYDGKLVVYDGAYMDSQTPVGKLSVVPGDDYKLLNNDFARYGSSEVTDGHVTGTFSAGDGEVLSTKLNDRMSSPAEADRFAKGLLRYKNRKADRIRVSTDSFLQAYAPGSVITFAAKAAGSWDGPAFVEKMRYDFYKLKTTVEIRPILEGY